MRVVAQPFPIPALPTAPGRPDLPEPSEDAGRHSDRLTQSIRREIDAAGGWIVFARFMELALYAPGLGYYVAGAAKLGAEGDFVTAPEISPLFGRTLARQIAQLLERSGGQVLELGAICRARSEEHTSELQSPDHLVCRLLLEKKKKKQDYRQKDADQRADR